METRGRSRKNIRSRDMLLALESRVVHVKESMGEVKETLEVVEIGTDELDPMKEHFKEYVVEALSSNMGTVEALLNIVMEFNSTKSYSVQSNNSIEYQYNQWNGKSDSSLISDGSSFVLCLRVHSFCQRN
ncbi:hypothetical protein J1N35_021583 [Gossypium stocksii]|uniref:Uncharacterized protein n=1 Tax=Gossypium stocksii TaxID=47602 RepID=A0A9D3VGI8_9ROSI|nr:hypothetical protein J1N35_021583 [Gossypium stocksii]